MTEPERIGDVMQRGELVPAQASSYAREYAAPTDVRSLAMSLPPAQMLERLGEYLGSRTAFRDWIKSQLVQGVHYGFPPGCEPKFDGNGNVLIWMRGKEQPYPQEQWTPKESLYAAGADFVCDLLGLRDAYKADMDGWKQLGEPHGTFVYCCELYSRGTGELVSEGRGAAKVGEKKRDENASIKIAKKCAKVDAVLNAYGLRDLFTQDEAPRPPRHDNPPKDEDAPKAATRAQRKEPPVTKEEVIALAREVATFSDGEFGEFVLEATGVNFNVRVVGEWTREYHNQVAYAIALKTGGMPPAGDES